MKASYKALKQVFVDHSKQAAISTSLSILSYRECLERIDHISCQLSSLTKSGSVAIWGSNSSDYLLLLSALWLRSQTAFPLNTRLPVNQLNNLLNRAECDLLISLEESPPDFAAETILLSELPADISGTNNYSDHPATHLATSGSSGTPKIAVHSLDNHYYSALGSNTNIPLQPGDRWLLSLPLYHVGGIAIWMRCLLAGASVYVPGEKEKLVDILLKQHVTHLSLVSTQLQRLLEEPSVIPKLRQLKAILLGGSAIPQPLLQRCTDEQLPVHTSYGSTEMSSQITTTGVGENVLTSGKLLQHRELRIAEDGEILVGGKTLFSGYLEDGEVEPAVDTDGWFHTRDSGYLDADGNLIVTGRMDHMFISGGENIQPAEIEKALESLPEIIRAIVVAVDDREFGKRPVAFIQLKPNSELNEDLIKENLRNTLAGYKIPKSILPLPTEILATGLKPDRNRLQGIAERASGIGHR